MYAIGLTAFTISCPKLTRPFMQPKQWLPKTAILESFSLQTLNQSFFLLVARELKQAPKRAFMRQAADPTAATQVIQPDMGGIIFRK